MPSQADQDRAKQALQKLRRRLLEAREREENVVKGLGGVSNANMDIIATKKLHNSLRSR